MWNSGDIFQKKTIFEKKNDDLHFDTQYRQKNILLKHYNDSIYAFMSFDHASERAERKTTVFSNKIYIVLEMLYFSSIDTKGIILVLGGLLKIQEK